MNAALPALALALTLALLWGPLHAMACAVGGAQAYQASSAEVAAAMDQASLARLGSPYPPLPPLERGYPRAATVEAPVPCVLLKAVGYVEGSWQQAAGSVPVGTTGPVKQSASCGYGIMQITSGMRQPGELPPEVQGHIATDYRYNIAWGAKLLAEKWNAGDFQGAVVGNRDPAAVEHWYYAVWAYNQFTFKNNPNNPDYPWPRPAFDGTQSRTDYPYQELVWGLAAHPPVEAGTALWQGTPLALPDRDQIAETPGPIPAPASTHLATCRLLTAEPTLVELRTAGDADPLARTLTLGSTAGAEQVTWQFAPPAEPWLRVTPMSGGTFPAQVTLSVDPRGLRPGPHIAALTLTAPAAGYTPLTVTVRVQLEGSTRFFFPWLPNRLAPAR